MYTKEEYKKLVGKYGGCSSWAIWDYKDENILSVIEDNYQEIHSNYIFLGLNISKPLKSGAWKNFHGGKHDRKLKYACNDTILRGSYITDLFKGIPEVNSLQFENKLTQEIISSNVGFFIQEMKNVKIDSQSIFVLLGTQSSPVARCFNSYFRKNFNNKVLYYYHHSYYGISDEEWVTGLWRKFNIDKNYSDVIKQYVGKRD